jgi:hypothetical protein
MFLNEEALVLVWRGLALIFGPNQAKLTKGKFSTFLAQILAHRKIQ